MDLPLDLPDSISIGPVEQFEIARANLDKNGWSGNVMVNPVSRFRAVLLLSMICEEVLELSIGPQTPNIAEKASPIHSSDLEAETPPPREILSKLTLTWQSIFQIQFERSMCETKLPSAIWVVSGPRLDYLYTKILLHKLLITHTEGNRERMIQTSHDILYLALSLMKKHDLIATPNLEWLVGLILNIDGGLRNARRQHTHLRNFREKRQRHRSTVLNRSTLIRDIGVLISCCDSLAISGQSNYQICKQAQEDFSRCLDQMLNANELCSHGLTRQAGGEEAQEPFSLSSMNFSLTDLYPENPEWST
ncbi:hypothetical protein N7520_005529 [Penicillium odoratum]|uniref:uncharacterized protein n=1 Tax=Penicillium odoratum TaxID=1167516 RepID=UPI0025475B5D|nr:uncharacterized protein N7520_005529 [Penicillium odoratum]KAJ5758373.1 hypothetical protein N7520_005529 [Penicillium odoratum]